MLVNNYLFLVTGGADIVHRRLLVYIYCAQETSIYLYCAHTSIYLYCVQETSICTFIMSYCHETLTYSLSYGAMGWVPQWGGDIVICWGSVVAWYYRVIWLSPLPPPHSKQYQYPGHHDLAGDGNTPTASCDSNEGFALCKHGIWFYDFHYKKGPTTKNFDVFCMAFEFKASIFSVTYSFVGSELAENFSAFQVLMAFVRFVHCKNT